MNKFFGLIGLLTVLALYSCGEQETAQEEEKLHTLGTGTGSTGSTGGGKD